MAELSEAVVEDLLAEEFVEAVVGDIIADQEHALDVIANISRLVGVVGGSEGDAGLTTIGRASTHDGSTGNTGLIELIELFEGKGYYGEFDQAGGIEVLAGI